MDYIKHSYIILAIVVIALLSFDRYELVPSHTGSTHFMKIDKITGATYVIHLGERKEYRVITDD